MIGNKDRVLDDIARVAGGTISVFSGLSQNIREEIKSRMDETAQRLDLVPREDLERLETMLAAQNARIEALEKQLSAKPVQKNKTAKKKK